MAQGIDEFRGQIANFARPTLFKVSIPSIIDQTTEFLVKAANLPAATVGIIEVPYMGRKIKIPGDRTYSEWTITVMNDQSMVVRKQFEDWNNQLNDAEQNVGYNQIATVLHDAFVKQLATDGSVIAEYKLVGCFPSEVGEIEVSWESNDTIEEYQVTLAYQYWTRIA